MLAAALAGGSIGAAVGFGLRGHSSSASRAPVELAVGRRRDGESPEQLYERAARAVVAITSAQRRPTALGSGFIVDKSGDVVTNDAVVHGRTRVRIGFSGGTSYPARVVGDDAVTDVGVVRVRAPRRALQPLGFADSAALQVGDAVFALGDPSGIDRTMTAGIVSAVGRRIQTDAPVGRGSSGGPLVDPKGGVVGVDVRGGGDGVAVPSNTARTIARQLIEHGRASHAWLGVQTETIDPSLAHDVHGLPARGAAIARVAAGSPAADAGLKGAAGAITVDGLSAPVGGDTIVALDGKAVDTSEQLADAVAGHRPGDRIRLTVVRGGRHRTVFVTLANGHGRRP